MSGLEYCIFYRDFETGRIGHGIGLCELDSIPTICGGDDRFCEKPHSVRKHLWKNRKGKIIREDGREEMSTS